MASVSWPVGGIPPDGVTVGENSQGQLTVLEAPKLVTPHGFSIQEDQNNYLGFFDSTTDEALLLDSSGILWAMPAVGASNTQLIAFARVPQIPKLTATVNGITYSSQAPDTYHGFYGTTGHTGLAGNGYVTIGAGGPNVNISNVAAVDMQPLSQFKGVSVVGLGFPINRAQNRLTGQTAAVTVTSFKPSGTAVEQAEAGGWIDITAYTSGTINLEVSYTDGTGTARVVTIASASALGPSDSGVVHFDVTEGNTITLETAGTFTATYNVGGTIFELG